MSPILKRALLCAWIIGISFSLGRDYESRIHAAEIDKWEGVFTFDSTAWCGREYLTGVGRVKVDWTQLKTSCSDADEAKMLSALFQAKAQR
jgi:hypothetical protein